MSAGKERSAATPLESPGSANPRLAILYEHPAWFEKVFAELDRRGIAYQKLLSPDHFFDLGGPGRPYPVLFNRMSPSAWRREHGSGLFYTLSYLAHLESLGTRVINGSRAFRHELSKALQLSLLRSLNLPFPRTRVIHSPHQAPEAATDLRFPVVIKPNIGGSGAGVVRFNRPEDLVTAVRSDQVQLGFDHVGLVQEFIPARGSFITRIETLRGRYLYGIRVHLTGETFDLCPADICQTTRGEELLAPGCVVEAGKAGLKVERYDPPPEIVRAVESIAQGAGIDVGGIEYIIDDRDGQIYFYDVNALSNFVADAPRVVGFDPFVRLVDFIEEVLSDAPA
jgi:hypothetical protein